MQENNEADFLFSFHQTNDTVIYTCVVEIKRDSKIKLLCCYNMTVS
jgi:hypothetical protein